MTRSRKDKDRPSAGVGRLLDRHLGRRLAQRRRELNCSPAELDAAIGVPAGTKLRYESGVKALDAARLVALCLALGVSISYFFEGMPELPLAGAGDLPEPDRIAETARFIDAYYKIADDNLRRDILLLLKAASDT